MAALLEMRPSLSPSKSIRTSQLLPLQVLAEIGPEGLSIGEIARRIQQSGLRDLRTSKTPEVCSLHSPHCLDDLPDSS